MAGDLHDTTPRKILPGTQKRLENHESVIIKLKTGPDLCQVPHMELSLAIVIATELIPAKRRNLRQGPDFNKI